MAGAALGLLLGFTALGAAAELAVYSEFRRVGPDGEVVAADQGGRVREILSPAVPRNAYSTFHVVVKGEPGESFWLYVGQNPDDNARVTVYAVDAPGDQLRKVNVPVEIQIPAGARAAVYVMDLFYTRQAPVERVKIEPQLWVASEKRWVVYPMEVRVQPAQIPAIPVLRNPMARTGDPADSAASAALREHMCETEFPVSTRPALTLQALIDRNARQDIAFLRTLGKERTASLLPDRGPFCSGSAQLPPEWWLTLRRLLYQ
jgi:hypothetical protein